MTTFIDRLGSPQQPRHPPGGGRGEKLSAADRHRLPVSARGGSRTRARRRLGSILGLVLVALASLDVEAHAQELQQNSVEDLYRKGRAARERGDLAYAFELLSDAWSRRKTHDVAASLAQVEYELGRVRDAAEHLAYACEHLPASADPARVERLFTALEQIKRKLVTLSLVVEPNTADVSLDGRSLGLALALPKEVFADPGSISLSAELEGYAHWQTTLRGEAGDQKDIRVRLERVEDAAAKHAGAAQNLTPARDTAKPLRQAKPSSAPFIASATFTGLALASGITFWVLADARESHAEERLAEIPGDNRCGAGSPFLATCADVRSGLKSAKTFRALSYGAFGLSLAGAAVSYLVWPRQERRSVALGTAFSASSGWFGAEGRF
jgi:hypothetical protein